MPDVFGHPALSRGFLARKNLPWRLGAVYSMLSAPLGLNHVAEWIEAHFEMAFLPLFILLKQN